MEGEVAGAPSPAGLGRSAPAPKNCPGGWRQISLIEFALLGLFVLGGCGLQTPGSLAPQTGKPESGLRGQFSAVLMVHTPDWPAATDVKPWDGQTDGTFTYRSIPCSGNAPVNNISTDLPTYNTQVPGSRSPASTRAHPFEFTVEAGKMKGRLVWTVCKLGGGPTTDDLPDAARDKIYVDFEATATRVTAEEVVFSGSFKLAGGTGRYADLTGEGTIAGYFFCFDPQGCAANQGRYRDGQFVMFGTYYDPTGPN